MKKLSTSVLALSLSLFSGLTLAEEYLGDDEIKVATVQVCRVLPKMSYADLMSGSLDDIEALQAARQCDCPNDEAITKKDKQDEYISFPEGGGVRL